MPAPGSIPEFLVELIGAKYKLDLQAAPYRGSAPMIADMLGNQITAGIASVPDFIENHKAGKVRIVAVIGDRRQPLLPDVPTFSELGFASLDDLPVLRPLRARRHAAAGDRPLRPGAAAGDGHAGRAGEADRAGADVAYQPQGQLRAACAAIHRLGKGSSQASAGFTSGAQ